MAGSSCGGDRGAAGVAARDSHDRRFPAGRRRVHGLRDVVPRGADRRRGGAGARARARPGRAGAATRSSSSRTRATRALALEAARAFDGPRWLITGKPDSPLGELCEEVVVATPAIEQSWCHTASYTCAVATIAGVPRARRLRAGRRSGGGARRPRAGVRSRAVPDRGRGARLADGAGGGAEAARGRVRGRRGARDGAAAARPSGGGRRDGALLRARGRGAGGRASRARRPRRCGSSGARRRWWRPRIRWWTSSASSC